MTSYAHLAPEIRAAIEADTTIDITTTGRKTGQARRIEIWFLNVDGTIYITGSTGRRDWFANLLANPAFRFHLKESATADLDALATRVTDAGERKRVFDAATARWYRQQEPVDQLLADAPLVRVDLSAA